MARKHPSQRKSRQSRPRVLIIVEGDTGKSEQTYFQLLARELRSNKSAVDVKVIPGKGEPSKLLSKCLVEKERHEEEYDHFCLVVDADEHAKLEEVLREAPGQGINVVVTNPQFELWLLWHVLDQHGFISGAEAADKAYKLGLTTGKNGKELARLFPVHSFQEAQQRARQVWPELRPNQIGSNPSSSIPWLIEAIQSGAFSI